MGYAKKRRGRRLTKPWRHYAILGACAELNGRMPPNTVARHTMRAMSISFSSLPAIASSLLRDSGATNIACMQAPARMLTSNIEHDGPGIMYWFIPACHFENRLRPPCTLKSSAEIICRAPPLSPRSGCRWRRHAHRIPYGCRVRRSHLRVQFLLASLPTDMSNLSDTGSKGWGCFP